MHGYHKICNDLERLVTFYESVKNQRLRCDIAKFDQFEADLMYYIIEEFELYVKELFGYREHSRDLNIDFTMSLFENCFDGLPKKD